MGRPITGSLRQRGKSWYASVPPTKGEKRIEYRFNSEQQAQTWMAVAVEAVAGGSALPDPDAYRSTWISSGVVGSTTTSSISFDAVARHWHEASYETMRKAQPERAKQVEDILRLHVIPWFGPRFPSVDLFGQHGYDVTLDFVRHLAGQDIVPAPQVALTPGVATISEAAKITGRAMPTIRRHWRAGQFPNGYVDAGGRVRIPVTDLVNAGLMGKPKERGGLSKNYASEILWVLREVVSYAVNRGWLTMDPTKGIVAIEPDESKAYTKQRKSKKQPWGLRDCRRIAAHLHVIFQLTLWLQRILGVRISEAYGPCVGDVIDQGHGGLLVLGSQGGRSFLVRDKSGAIVTRHEKDNGKTNAAQRVVKIPEPLMVIIRTVVEVFHTDPATGEVDPEARLIPGIKEHNKSGQSAFRCALAKALAVEGMSSDDMDARMSPHELRRSLTTDLAWDGKLDRIAIRRFVGHAVGSDTFDRVYTMDHPELLPLVAVAASIERNIDDELDGSLLAPTIQRFSFGPNHPLKRSQQNIDFLLAEAGWHLELHDGEDVLCDSGRVASELGVSEKVARRMIAAEFLPSVVVPDAEGRPRRHVRLDQLVDERDRLAKMTLLPEVADRMNIGYHDAWNSVRRLGLNLEKHRWTDEYLLTEEDVSLLEAEQGRIVALWARSMKVSGAACELGKAHSTINHLLKQGKLLLDDETDTSGARFVTRASVEAYRLTSTRRNSSGEHDSTLEPIDAAASRLDLSVHGVMELVRAGKLAQRHIDRRCYITGESLAKWTMAEQDNVV